MGRNLETAFERLRRTLEGVPAEVMERRLREAEALEARALERPKRKGRKKSEARTLLRQGSERVDVVDRVDYVGRGAVGRRRGDGDGIERGREWVPEEDWRRGYWDEERLERAGFR